MYIAGMEYMGGENRTRFLGRRFCFCRLACLLSSWNWIQVQHRWEMVSRRIAEEKQAKIICDRGGMDGYNDARRLFIIVYVRGIVILYHGIVSPSFELLW
jgi:hypothetical protein